MELLKKMKKIYGIAPLKNPKQEDMVYWKNWFTNDFKDNKNGRKNTAKNFIYWLDGLKIVDWYVAGEETIQTKELKIILGQRLMELLEIGYDFEQNTFKCYLPATKETVKLMNETIERKKETYPQELRFRLLFQTKGEKQRVLREYIEKQVSELLRLKGFESFLMEEIPVEMQRMNQLIE